MADAPTIRKKYAATYSDKLNPTHTAAQKVSVQRMRLWDALHEYCRGEGAHIVSVPGLRELRIEVPGDSTLASKLSELGYDPVHRGRTTRIDAGNFMSVDVISILLPGNYKQ